MFGNKKDDIQEYLIKKGYDIKEFINKNGDSYYFKVRTTWQGSHTVKVKENFLGIGYDIKKISD